VSFIIDGINFERIALQFYREKKIIISSISLTPGLRVSLTLFQG